MKNEIKKRCHIIIHTHAVAAAAGNAVPIPGLGWAADTITMTTMAMSLASVFGEDIPQSVAKAMAINAIRRTILKRPVKLIVKELSKVVPFLGQCVAPAMSVAMLEAAGWALANGFEIQSLAHMQASKCNI